jgi:hypothetical protein
MHDPLAGAEVLTKAHELITGARQKSYSHPYEDYSRTVSIYNALKGEDLMTAEDGILFMVCVKLSRLMHELESGQNLPDNLIDAAGYLGCLAMVREHLRYTDIELARMFKTGESWDS